MDVFDPAPELPDGSQPPASEEGAAPVAEATGDDFVEFKNGDDVLRVSRATAQAFADEAGVPLDNFKRDYQIGRDGTRLYGQFEEWRQEQIAQIDEERRQARAEASRHPGVQPSQPAPPSAVRARPNPQDVVGTINWLADRIESIEASGGKPPQELLERLAQFESRIEERELASERLEERGYASQCYDEVKVSWKKEYGTEPPSQREMWNYLRRFPMHEDPNMTWHEIWNAIGFALKGPAMYRMSKRQATADLTKPDARVLVPAGNRASGAAPSAPSTGNDEQDIASLEQALQGVPASVLMPGINR